LSQADKFCAPEIIIIQHKQESQLLLTSCVMLVQCPMVSVGIAQFKTQYMYSKSHNILLPSLHDGNDMSFKVVGNGSSRQSRYYFLLVAPQHHVSLLYHF